MDYSEADLQQIGQFRFLQKAGMEMDSLRQLARLLEKKSDTHKEQVRLLRKLRFELLEEIHGRQQDLDRLDYFIHEISKQKKGDERT